MLAVDSDAVVQLARGVGLIGRGLPRKSSTGCPRCELLGNAEQPGSADVEQAHRPLLIDDDDRRTDAIDDGLVDKIKGPVAVCFRHRTPGQCVSVFEVVPRMQHDTNCG